MKSKFSVDATRCVRTQHFKLGYIVYSSTTEKCSKRVLKSLCRKTLKSSYEVLCLNCKNYSNS